MVFYTAMETFPVDKFYDIDGAADDLKEFWDDYEPVNKFFI